MRVMLWWGDMEGRGLLWAFAWADDSRMEAFEALRASVRMLGVRKSGLGVRMALLEKESMMALYWLSFPNCRVPARVTLLIAPGGQEKGLVAAWQT